MVRHWGRHKHLFLPLRPLSACCLSVFFLLLQHSQGRGWTSCYISRASHVLSPSCAHTLFIFSPIKWQSLFIHSYLSPSTFCLSFNYQLTATFLQPPLWHSDGSSLLTENSRAGEQSSLPDVHSSIQPAAFSLPLLLNPLCVYHPLFFLIPLIFFFCSLLSSLHLFSLTLSSSLFVSPSLSITVWQWVVWTVHLYACSPLPQHYACLT